MYSGKCDSLLQVIYISVQVIDSLLQVIYISVQVIYISVHVSVILCFR